MPERMYQSLREGRLPRVYPAGTLVKRTQGVAQTLRMRRDGVRNLATKLVRPLAYRKAVAITDSALSGYETTFRGAYLGLYGNELSYKVGYKSQFKRPTMAKLVQSIGDVEETTHTLFMPEAPYTKTVKKPITKPEALACAASVISEKGFFKYDALSEQFNVGVFDDRYKSVAEYPVSGVDNAILDLSYNWKVENKVYPMPLPSGLSFYNFDVIASSGFLAHSGKYYKDPSVTNYVTVLATIKNRTGAKIRIEHWGLPISVLYEENKRVSQSDLGDIYFTPSRDIANGTDYGCGWTIALPDWCYGKIAVAYAMNFYKDGMFIYGGGPLFQFEIFRILLP